MDSVGRVRWELEVEVTLLLPELDGVLGVVFEVHKNAPSATCCLRHVLCKRSSTSTSRSAATKPTSRSYFFVCVSRELVAKGLVRRVSE
jgi:hypothetical protein